MNRPMSVAAVFAVVTAFTQIGCASDDGGAEETPREQQIISGQLDTGTPAPASGIGTRDVRVSGDGGAVHVVAHRLGGKGEASVDIDSAVAADGSFELKLDRGARYVFEVERGDASVAFFGWSASRGGGKTTVLGLSSSTRGQGAVSLGRVKVVGNGAVPEHCLCDTFDEGDTTGIDLSASWFVTAQGALMTADEALAVAADALKEAEAALEEARARLEEANAQIDDAKKTVEEARSRIPSQE